MRRFQVTYIVGHLACIMLYSYSTVLMTYRLRCETEFRQGQGLDHIPGKTLKTFQAKSET